MTEGASDGGRMLLLIDYMFIALLSRVVNLAHAHIGSVAVLCCLLGCVEELLSLVWTYLLEGEVTNLAVEELTEQRVQCRIHLSIAES